MKMNRLFPCYASAAFGMEGLVAAELRSLKLKEVAAENGGVRFLASAEELMICNLHMHFCERIFLIAGEKNCQSFEDLYQLVFSVPWNEYAEGTEAFIITAKCARSRLMSPRDCQSVSKKAVLEKLHRTLQRNTFPENGSPLLIHISIHSDLVKILVNTSGEALSRRGYRTWNGEAPMRETLAAALVFLSNWNKEQPLYDPCCGTGTILTEAALMALNAAPGLKRSFAMEKMHAFRSVPFDEIRVKETARVSSDRPLRVAGSDISQEAVDLARRHILQAGLKDKVFVSCKPLQEVTLQEKGGVFICNPPYGERLGDQRTCRMLYRDLRMLKERHPTWSMCVISSDPAFERYFEKRADKKRRLYNGRLECTYYIYH